MMSQKVVKSTSYKVLYADNLIVQYLASVISCKIRRIYFYFVSFKKHSSFVLRVILVIRNIFCANMYLILEIFHHIYFVGTAQIEIQFHESLILYALISCECSHILNKTPFATRLVRTYI